MVYNFFLKMATTSTSPLYTQFISPLCDFIVTTFVPNWVTPNQLSFAGLFSAYFAVFSVVYGHYIYGALAWFLYGILDNLDGKQARATGQSSRGGDCVDHAIDCVVCALMPIYGANILMGTSIILPRNRCFLAVGCAVQFSMYLACYGHILLGRLFLGSNIHGPSYFTVDELNLILFPLFSIVRGVRPDILDYQLSDTWTVGSLVYISVLPFSVFCIIWVMCQLVREMRQKKASLHLHLLLPGLITIMYIISFVPQRVSLMTVSAFPMLNSIELVVYRLTKGRKSKWIWTGTLLGIVILFRFPMIPEWYIYAVVPLLIRFYALMIDYQDEGTDEATFLR